MLCATYAFKLMLGSLARWEVMLVSQRRPESSVGARLECPVCVCAHDMCSRALRPHTGHMSISADLPFRCMSLWVPHVCVSLCLCVRSCLQHNQDRLVEQQGGPSKAFFIPDPTDAALSELMVWFKKAGPIPYPQGQKLPPRLPKEQVLERYNAHVAHCKHCQQGLATLRLVTVLAGLAAGLLAAAAAAQAAVAVVSPVAVPALPWLAVAAVVLGWVGWSAYKLQKRFFVGDCDHRRS